MLVLGRKRDEEVVLILGNQEMTIRVMDIRGDKVRLGIAAPPEMLVHRKEVWEAVKRENAERGSV